MFLFMSLTLLGLVGIYSFVNSDKPTLEKVSNKNNRIVNHLNIFFLSFTNTDHSRDSRGREEPSLFFLTTYTRSRTFRHIFATLHLRWLSRIFNLSSCNYQSVTRWDLSAARNYHLIECWCDFFLSSSFNARYSCRKPVDLNSHRLSP